MRFSVVAAAVVVVSAGAACDGPADCNSVEPAYAGEATDETWRVMLDARTQAEESSDVEITVPQNGAEVTVGDDPPALAWDSTLQVAVNHGPVRARARPGLLDALGALVFPVAHAHLPPITSDLYLLEIDVPGRTCPVAALTTLESMIFSDDDWQEVAGEPGERTLRMLSAFVTENRITEGPFAAAPVTFTVVE